MKRIIFHIDVNNAFLSWTALERLKDGEKVDLRNIAAVIGGSEKERRGIVLAKSMPAKEKGIVTAETLFSARKKCPNLVVVPPTFNVYQKYSNAMYNLLLQYSSVIERYSIDECFVDMTGTETLFGKPYDLANKIKNEIYNKLGFTVNIGIGNNKLCAKMASDFTKPNRIHTLYDEEVKEKMWHLPIGDLFMSGKKTTNKLKNFNINTIGELANTDVDFLYRNFKKQGLLLHNYANGIDDSKVYYIKEPSKGIGNSVTVPKDLFEEKDIEKVLLELSEQVSKRLRNEKVYASVITVQLKNNNFYSYSHQQKLDYGINRITDIYRVAKNLFRKMWKEDAIRLVGIRATNFVDNTYEQMSIFNIPSQKENNELQQLFDKINSKYGKNVIDNALLLNRNKK